MSNDELYCLFNKMSLTSLMVYNIQVYSSKQLHGPHGCVSEERVQVRQRDSFCLYQSEAMN